MPALNPKIQYLTAEWLLPVVTPPITDGVVAIEDGRITAVGQRAEFGESVDIPPPQPGSLLSPGLINTHLHLEQTFPALIPHDPTQPFMEWLKQVVATNMAHAGTADKATRCQRGSEELLRTGTTCVNDISSGPEALTVLDQAGLRGIVSVEWFHPGHETINVDAYVGQYQAMAEQYATHPRLRAGLAPHTPYNFSPAAWQALLQAAPEAWIHTHVAEFEDEVRYLQGKNSCIQELHRKMLGQTFPPQGTAPSPVAYLANHRLLNARTLTAHAVHTSAQDRQLLAEAGVSVAHCPRSNLALHGQTLRWADWADSGIAVGLGTDGRLSTEDLDVRAEARFARQVHGWDAAWTLDMLTRQGARALKMESQTGALTPCLWADCVLWQAADNVQDAPEERLLHPATQAQQVWIGGECQWRVAS